jgi:hypothetical protein
VIALHREAFLDVVAEAGDGAGLPQFVEREFRELCCAACSKPQFSRARRTPSCVRGEALSVLIRPARLPVDGGHVPA